jgi:hypothetical protein
MESLGQAQIMEVMFYLLQLICIQIQKIQQHFGNNNFPLPEQVTYYNIPDSETQEHKVGDELQQ